MKKYFPLYIMFFGALIIFSFVFFSYKAKASDGWVTITSPTPGGALQNLQTFSVYLIQTASWGDIEYSSDLVNWKIGCQTTSFISSGFTCSFNTNTLEFPPGQNYFRARATMGSEHFSDPITLYKSGPITITPSPGPTSSGSGGTSPKSTATPKIITSPTPIINPTITPSPEMTISSKPIPGRPDLSPIPIAAPVITPIVSPILRDLFSGSEVFSTIKFNAFQDKSVRLEKIEGRKTPTQAKFLYFNGKSVPNSSVTMKILSQPLVMSAQTDSSGNWTYTLEKPLEPGKHKVYLEVNNNGVTESSGPYPFNIARAQASTDNPTGASLDLIDPQKQMMKNYLYSAAGIVVVGLLVLLFILYLRRIKKLRTPNNPAKEPSAT